MTNRKKSTRSLRLVSPLGLSSLGPFARSPSLISPLGLRSDYLLNRFGLSFWRVLYFLSAQSLSLNYRVDSIYSISSISSGALHPKLCRPVTFVLWKFSRLPMRSLNNPLRYSPLPKLSAPRSANCAPATSTLPSGPLLFANSNR